MLLTPESIQNFVIQSRYWHSTIDNSQYVLRVSIFVTNSHSYQNFTYITSATQSFSLADVYDYYRQYQNPDSQLSISNNEPFTEENHKAVTFFQLSDTFKTEVVTPIVVQLTQNIKQDWLKDHPDWFTLDHGIVKLSPSVRILIDSINL